MKPPTMTKSTPFSHTSRNATEKKKEKPPDKKADKKADKKSDKSEEEDKPKSRSQNLSPATRKKKCANCCKQFTAFLFSTVGLSCLMVGYTVLGGFIFMKVEAPNELMQKANVMQWRHHYAEMLWNLTLDMNIFYPENWTHTAEQILENYTTIIYLATKKQGWDGKDGPQELQWTFAGSLLYSITVITTIGQSFYLYRPNYIYRPNIVFILV